MDMDRAGSRSELIRAEFRRSADLADVGLMLVTANTVGCTDFGSNLAETVLRKSPRKGKKSVLHIFTNGQPSLVRRIERQKTYNLVLESLCVQVFGIALRVTWNGFKLARSN